MTPPRPPDLVVGGVQVRMSIPDGLRGAAPLVLAHDGCAYEQYGELARSVTGSAMPPARIALLDVVDRRTSYAAYEPYARALTQGVLPALRARFETSSTLGIGASLGALAVLHAHERGAGFDALLVQSGSFFTADLDPQESGFAGFGAVAAFVASLDRGRSAHPVPVRLSCGLQEENLANNRRMAAALTRRGHAARLDEAPGGHDWDGWRAALGPALRGLLETDAMRPGPDGWEMIGRTTRAAADSAEPRAGGR